MDPHGESFFLEVSTPCRKQISTLNCATGTLASKKVDVAVMPVALEGQGLQGGHATYTRDRGQPADLTPTRASSSTRATPQRPSFKVPFSQSGASQGHLDRGHTMSRHSKDIVRWFQPHTDFVLLGWPLKEKPEN